MWLQQKIILGSLNCSFMLARFQWEVARPVVLGSFLCESLDPQLTDCVSLLSFKETDAHLRKPVLYFLITMDLSLGDTKTAWMLSAKIWERLLQHTSQSTVQSICNQSSIYQSLESTKFHRFKWQHWPPTSKYNYSMDSSGNCLHLWQQESFIWQIRMVAYGSMMAAELSIKRQWGPSICSH